MFKKMMARLGKGAAKVDLILSKPTVPLGGMVEGEVLIQGGAVTQMINTVEVKFHFEVKVRETIYTHLIAVIPYQASTKIQPGQNIRVPFQLPLPYDLLLSSDSVSYFFTTHLDIAGGIDSSDRDYLKIAPPHELDQVFKALDLLGFQEKAHSRSFNGEVQEFIFTPTAFLSEEISTLSFSAVIDETELLLVTELEFGAFFGKEVRKDEIFLTPYQLQNTRKLTDILREVLERIVYHDRRPSALTGKQGAVGEFVQQILSKK